MGWMRDVYSLQVNHKNVYVYTKNIYIVFFLKYFFVIYLFVCLFTFFSRTPPFSHHPFMARSSTKSTTPPGTAWWVETLDRMSLTRRSISSISTWDKSGNPNERAEGEDEEGGSCLCQGGSFYCNTLDLPKLCVTFCAF